MKFNFKVLLDILSKNKEITIIKTVQNIELNIENVSLEQISPTTLTITSKKIDTPALYVNVDYPVNQNQAIIQTSLSKNRLLTLIQSFIIEEENIMGNFVELIHSNASLDLLMSYMHQYLLNPIILYDSHFHVLSYTKEDIIHHHLWKDIVDSGGVYELNESLPDTFFDYVDTLQTNKEIPQRINSPDLLSPFINMNVYYKNKRFATMAVAEYHHPCSQLELMRIVHFSKLLTFEMQKSLQITSDSYQEQLLLDILEKRITQSNIKNRVKNPIYYKKSHYELIEISNHSAKNTEVYFNNAKTRFFIQVPNGLCCLYKSHLIIACSDENRSIVQLFIKNEFENKDVQIAISDAFTQLTTASEMLYQFDIIRTLAHHKTASFSDIRLDYILDILSNGKHINAIFHPAIIQLAKNDKEYGTDYLTTLAIYLKCNQRQSEAAKQLSLHRSTLLYRLDKIVELTQIDFDDYQQMLLIQFGLAYFYHKGNNRKEKI